MSKKFEGISSELFQPVSQEELKMIKGGDGGGTCGTISAKNSDPNYRDIKSEADLPSQP